MIYGREETRIKRMAMWDMRVDRTPLGVRLGKSTYKREIFILRGSVFTICTLLNSTMKFQKQNSVSSSPSFGRDESTLAMKIPKSVIC